MVIVYGALSHHFLAGLLERVVAADRRGHHRPGLREVLRDLPWRRLIVADLLLTTMVAAGLALFVVPGLVALTWFSVTLPIVNLERKPVPASFTRSYHLTHDPTLAASTTASLVPIVSADRAGTGGGARARCSRTRG